MSEIRQQAFPDEARRRRENQPTGQAPADAAESLGTVGEAPPRIEYFKPTPQGWIARGAVLALVAGLVLLNVALGIVGVFCCIVGVYFVLPVTLAADAIAYRRVFPEVSQNFPSPPPPPANWAA